MMPPEKFAAWAAGFWLMMIAACALSFWLNGPDLHTRRQYATQINKAAATSLWKWNINSEDAPGHSHR